MEDEHEVRVLRSLRNAFASLSLEEIAAAYTEADGDPVAAAQILSSEFQVKPSNSNSTKNVIVSSCSASTATLQPQDLRRTRADPLSAAEAPFDRPSLSKLKDYHFPPLSTSPSSPPKTYSSSSQTNNRTKRFSNSGSLNGSCQPTRKSKPTGGSASFGAVSSVRVTRVGEAYKSFRTCPKNRFSSSGTSAPCCSTSQRHGQGNIDMFSFAKKDALQQEKVVEHVYSMLGDGFQLGIDYVRDVLGICEGDVHKSLDILLNTCKSSSMHVNLPKTEESFRLSETNVDLDDTQSNYSIDFSVDADSEYDLDGIEMHLKGIRADCEIIELVERDDGNENDLGIVFAPMTHSNNLRVSQTTVKNYSKIKDMVKQLHHSFPNTEMQTLFEVLRAYDFNYSAAIQYLVQDGESEENQTENAGSLSREIMESLFRGQPREVPSLDNVEQRSHEMARRQKDQNCSKEPKVGIVKSNASAIMKEIDRAYTKTYGSWDDYERHRVSANQHWTTMREYFQQAATAHQKGEYARAGILSEKAQEHRKLAEAARKRANERVSSLQMMEFENDLNLDLHGQHLGSIRRLLKLHLYLLASIPSIETLTLVTDKQGFHSSGGHSKLESAVVSYLEKKGVDWVEVAPHCIKVRKISTQSNDDSLLER